MTEAVPTTELAETTVPTPRPAPPMEAGPRRRHDGFYWDVVTGAWRPCPGAARP